MRISDWSSDVCSSDLAPRGRACIRHPARQRLDHHQAERIGETGEDKDVRPGVDGCKLVPVERPQKARLGILLPKPGQGRSEEHTSELPSIMRITYAVFCLKKKTTSEITTNDQSCQQNIQTG